MAKHYLKLSQILKRLLFEKNMRPVDLARELDMPGPTIHRIVTGKSTRPYKESLDAIAKYLDVSVDQLTGEEPLAPATMHDLHKLPISKSAKVVPILLWDQLGNTTTPARKNTNPDSELVVINVSDHAFALTMPDYSMEPLFQKGATLIFDPEKEVTDRGYPLIKLHDAKIYVFRQLLVDADQKFIKSLNSDISASSIKMLGPDDEIVAKLVEVRNQL